MTSMLLLSPIFSLLLLKIDARVAFGLCFLSVIDTFLVELKGTSGFLVHFQCEANVFYNGLQKGILNQLFHPLTTFNPQEEF